MATKTGARLTLVLLALMLAMLLATSCGDSTSQGYRGDTDGSIGFPAMSLGPAALEERIAGAAVIAKVRLQTVSAGTERWQPGVIDLPPDKSIAYIGTMVHTFIALEYLKGTGDATLVASVVVDEGSYGHESTGDALAEAQTYVSNRDRQWDSRDAIIFLSDRLNLLPDFPREDHYVLGGIAGVPGGDEDYYTIASPTWKLWLPEASQGTRGTRGRSTSRQSSDNQHFLLDAPSEGTSQTRSTSSSSADTITLRQMKAKIANIQKEVAAGDGSVAYAECIHYKYNAERRDSNINEKRGGEYLIWQHEVDAESGQPSNSLVHTDNYAPVFVARYGETQPDDFGELQLLDGDAALFDVRWPGKIFTRRPLPAGEYRFFFNIEAQKFIPCDGQPSGQKRNNEVIITVTTPAGTVHEAFFDPVSSGDAVGYFGTGDALKPTTFSKGDTNTTIQSLKWQDSAVTLMLSPYYALTGQVLDFITGDGTTILSLEASAATGDSTASTLTWSAGSQPWSSGDELLLRIRKPNGPPVFGQDSYSFSVPESASAFTIIGTVSATDVDGDTVTYHIISGNDGGDFNIDLNEGFILVWKKLDYETTSSYELTVEARDGRVGRDTATVTIEVTDVVE